MVAFSTVPSKPHSCRVPPSAPKVLCFLSVFSFCVFGKHQTHQVDPGSQKIDHASNRSKDIVASTVCQFIKGFIDALGGPGPRYRLKNHLGTPLPWVLLFHTAEVAKPGRLRNLRTRQGDNWDGFL